MPSKLLPSSIESRTTGQSLPFSVTSVILTLASASFESSVIFPVPPSGLASKGDKPEEEIVLSLAPFTPNPRVIFDNVTVGITATRQLIIENPTQIDLQLSATVPKPDIVISWQENIVLSNTRLVLDISWTPLKTSSECSVIHIRDQRGVRRDVTLILKSVLRAMKIKNNKMYKGIRKNAGSKNQQVCILPSSSKYRSPPRTKRKILQLSNGPNNLFPKSNEFQSVPNASPVIDLSTERNVTYKVVHDMERSNVRVASLCNASNLINLDSPLKRHEHYLHDKVKAQCGLDQPSKLRDPAGSRSFFDRLDTEILFTPNCKRKQYFHTETNSPSIVSLANNNYEKAYKAPTMSDDDNDKTLGAPLGSTYSVENDKILGAPLGSTYLVENDIKSSGKFRDSFTPVQLDYPDNVMKIVVNNKEEVTSNCTLLGTDLAMDFNFTNSCSPGNMSFFVADNLFAPRNSSTELKQCSPKDVSVSDEVCKELFSNNPLDSARSPKSNNKLSIEPYSQQVSSVMSPISDSSTVDCTNMQGYYRPTKSVMMATERNLFKIPQIPSREPKAVSAKAVIEANLWAEEKSFTDGESYKYLPNLPRIDEDSNIHLNMTSQLGISGICELTSNSSSKKNVTNVSELPNRNSTAFVRDIISFCISPAQKHKRFRSSMDELQSNTPRIQLHHMRSLEFLSNSKKTLAKSTIENKPKCKEQSDGYPKKLRQISSFCYCQRKLPVKNDTCSCYPEGF